MKTGIVAFLVIVSSIIVLFVAVALYQKPYETIAKNTINEPVVWTYWEGKSLHLFNCVMKVYNIIVTKPLFGEFILPQKILVNIWNFLPNGIL